MFSDRLLLAVAFGSILSWVPAAAEAGRIIWPCSGSVTSDYGPRSSPCSGCSTFHHGIDIGVGTGTYLGSPGNGTVISYVFESCGGNIHKIGYGNGWETRFAHLSAQVRGAGTVVTRNVDVARSGGTGSCTTGPHLHFEVRKDGASQLVPGSPGTWVTRGSEVPNEYPGLNDVVSPGDIPLVGDWNGDGVDTIGIYRNGEWHLRNSNSAGPAQIFFTFGLPTDKPVVGDWNGDGIDTPGIVRDGVWHLKNTNDGGGAFVSFAFGLSTDVPLVGDWDGNGADTIGIRRGAEWHLKNNIVAGPAYTSFSFGLSTDKPVVGDWDGNGVDSIGIRRGGEWHLKSSNDGGGAYTSFTFGVSTDVPVVGDWDGNNSETVGIRRSNVWHLSNTNTSAGAFTSFAYGL